MPIIEASHIVSGIAGGAGGVLIGEAFKPITDRVQDWQRYVLLFFFFFIIFVFFLSGEKRRG